jgi:hypothetical protein
MQNAVNACIQYHTSLYHAGMWPTRYLGKLGFSLIYSYSRGISYMMEDLGGVKCNVTVTKQLASCEHTAELPCSMNISKHSCSHPCGGIIGCCGRTCDSPCFDCQAKNPAGGTSRIERKLHREHLCKKPLYCGHDCLLPCLQGHECPPICREACRQRCAHRNCPASCSTPCELCKEVCTW